MKGEVLGDKLNTLRKKRGLTLENVADGIGYSTSAVQQWEKCGVCPTEDALYCLEQFFHVPLRDCSIIRQRTIDRKARETLREMAGSVQAMYRGCSLLGVSPEALAELKLDVVSTAITVDELQEMGMVGE